ncbi:MAG: YqaE/Pmp3 family membrane protein [Candidatus Omnitrophota bacterium]
MSVLMMILAIFLPPLAALLHAGRNSSRIDALC